jgi:hypothetical protein
MLLLPATSACYQLLICGVCGIGHLVFQLVTATALLAENLGEVLRGDRIENSPYQLQMRVDEQCKVLCRIESLTAEQAKAFKDKIEDDYKVFM